jgi:predicted dehydrogenase
MTLGIGIVGCGKIADAHVEEIRKLNCARIVAVCDLEPIIAEQLALRYAIPHWYTDIDRMLSQEKLNVIHIVTPPHSHFALTQKAVAAGCHVFLEKPLALNAMDGDRLIDCVQRYGRKMTINYWPNFESPALELREFVARGLLGDPVHIESYYGYDLTSAFGRALLKDDRHWIHQLPGKLFQNVIDHAVNKITPFLSDEDPEIVSRAYLRRGNLNGDSTDTVLDELRVMVLGGGVSAYLTFCSHARPVSHFVRVYGTKNIVHVDFAFRTMAIEPVQTVPTAFGRLLPPIKASWNSLGRAARNVREFTRSRFHYFEGMNRLLSLFYDCIEHNGPVPIPYADILRVSRIMDEIFVQAYSEQPV